jgi:hypothetical protein
MLYPKAFLVLFVILSSLFGCKSPSQMTAKEIGCNTRDVEIIDSEFKRNGSMTAWCARCGDRLYQCMTNPRRDRIECRRVDVGPPCE